MEVEGKGGVKEVGGECEGRKEQPKVNPLSLSKGENKKQTTQIVELITESLGLPKKDKHLHEWIVKEQATYVKEYGYEDFKKMDWVRYAKQYYPGSRA